IVPEGTTKVIQEKNEDQEKKAKKPIKRSFFRRKFVIALFVLLFLVVGAVILIALTSPKDVLIPDLEAYEFEEAEEILEELDLKVVKELVFSEDIEENHVVKTDPAAGRTVKQRTTVRVS